LKIERERRQYPRQTTFINAEYTVLEGTFRDTIKNIGAGGLFIKTDRAIAVGQPITVGFPLYNFDNVIQSVGRVVRIDLDGIAVTFNEAIEGPVCKEGHFPEIVNEADRPGT